MENFLMTTPFQPWRLSAYNILRSRKAYQFRHIQVEGRNHKVERTWFHVCLLRIPNVNESNDKWCDACQRTLPNSIYVESNTYRELDKVNAITAYYLHLHDVTIRNLSTVKHRIRRRRLCSRGRTTDAESICVVVNMVKNSLSTYQ